MPIFITYICRKCNVLSNTCNSSLFHVTPSRWKRVRLHSCCCINLVAIFRLIRFCQCSVKWRYNNSRALHCRQYADYILKILDNHCYVWYVCTRKKMFFFILDNKIIYQMRCSVLNTNALQYIFKWAGSELLQCTNSPVYHCHIGLFGCDGHQISNPLNRIFIETIIS